MQDTKPSIVTISGYPTKDFFKALDPAMENIVEEKLDAPIKSIGETAGYLTDSMARELGLLAGTPVGTGIIDAHSSLPGCENWKAWYNDDYRRNLFLSYDAF
ncbi:MAG: hypothetical protein ACLVIY_05625 [Anaerobutyricum soehngenii]